MTALPKLPQPLTPQSLVGLMRERAYWDATHPRFPTYQRLVKRGFEILYPGPERRDDTGMAINTPPRPPEHVAHLVEQTNRETGRQRTPPPPIATAPMEPRNISII